MHLRVPSQKLTKRYITTVNHTSFLPIYTMSTSEELQSQPRARSTPKNFDDIMEETQAKAVAARGGRTGRRTRGGRGGGRGSTAGGKRKPQAKKNIAPEENTLLDPALNDVSNKYPDPILTEAPKAYYETPQRETSLLQLRDQSVPVKSIEWPRTPTPSVGDHLGPSTPPISQSPGPRGSQTPQQSRDRESMSQTPGGTQKKPRKANYPWTYEREFAMLKALVEAKHRGLQTGASFKDAVWMETRTAVDAVPRDASVPDIDVSAMASKWGNWKEWWPDYQRHYGSGNVVKHTSGWEKNQSGAEWDYPGIEAGVLVSSEETMREHYLNYPRCKRFRKHRVNHVELLEQLLNDKMADGRGAAKVKELVKEGTLQPKKRSAKSDIRKQAMLNLNEAAGFEKLAAAIAGQNESKMGLAMQRVEKLEIFKGNPEAIGCLYEVFFADEKKADYFLNLPTHMMSWWVKKEFGGTITLDQHWNDREVERVAGKRNMNQTGVGMAQKRRKVAEEADDDDLDEDIEDIDDVEQGNGEVDDDVDEEDEFFEGLSQG